MKRRMDSKKAESGGKSIMRFFNIMAAMIFCILLAGAAHAQKSKGDSSTKKIQKESPDKAPAVTIMPSQVPSLGPPTTAPMQIQPSAGDLIKEPVKGHKTYDTDHLAPGGWSNTPAVSPGTFDLAVTDIFVGDNCKVFYTIKNVGGSFTPNNNYYTVGGMFCNKNNKCLSMTFSPAGLFAAGAQANFQAPNLLIQMEGFEASPFTVKILPEDLFPDNPSNNSLTKHLQCNQP